jgi:regulator of protease activity HflC (stomatin/prohibitin superfamily)
MRKIFSIFAALTVAISLTACGELVEVPPASKGMILGSNGYQGDIVPPSRFRLSPCLFLCDKLIVIEAGDSGMLEAMQVLMPKDNMLLGIDVRFTLGLANDDSKLLSVFDRVTPIQLESGNYGTTLDRVYEVYGASIVRNVVRSALSRYSIAEVAANQGEISEMLRQEVSTALSRTPLEIKQFGLADISYPDVVRQAMEANQKRRIEIEQADASAQVAIREAQARLEVARAEREADLLEAQTIRDADDILGAGVTPELIRYRELQVLQKMAENKNAIFFPVDMMGNLGLQNRVFQRQD